MSNLINTTNMTPIEVALDVDEQKRTTAKKLYLFLGLDKSQYSRWTKSKILNNQFAERNIDYWILDSDVEALDNDVETDNDNPVNKSRDYKLSATFAKKLAMGTNNERGEEARDYFIWAENVLKEAVLHINKAAIVSKRRPPTKIEKEAAIASNELTKAQSALTNAEAIKLLIDSLKEYVDICERAGMPAKNGLDAFSKQLAGFGIIVPDTKVVDNA